MGIMDDWKAEREKIETDIMKTVGTACVAAIEAMMPMTPVWMGTTVRNYGIATGGSNGGSKGSDFSGDPGDTNQGGKGPLGPEPARAGNESAALGEAQAVAAGLKKLQDVAVVNNSPHWDIVDAGGAPTEQLARYPGGISLVGEQILRSGLGDLG